MNTLACYISSRRLTSLAGLATLLLGSAGSVSCGNSDSGSDSDGATSATLALNPAYLVHYPDGSFCAALTARLRECGVLSEGEFQGCIPYGDSVETCELKCLADATCQDIAGCPTSDKYDICGNRCRQVEPVVCADGSEHAAFRACDGTKDCPGGEDEADAACRETGFPCRSGGIVASAQVCDGKRDCADGSDEASCKVLFSCSDLGDVGLPNPREKKIKPQDYCNASSQCSRREDEPDGCAKRMSICN
jgi:hypothetical protein